MTEELKLRDDGDLPLKDGAVLSGLEDALETLHKYEEDGVPPHVVSLFIGRFKHMRMRAEEQQDAFRILTSVAMMSGGTAGHNETLCRAIDRAVEALK